MLPKERGQRFYIHVHTELFRCGHLLSENEISDGRVSQEFNILTALIRGSWAVMGLLGTI